LLGGTNFQTPSLDAATGWLILEYMESGQRFFTTPQEYVAGRQYQGGRQTRVDEPTSAGIRAIDPENGKIVWDYKMTRGSLNNGLLATGGSLVFAAAPDGHLLVLDTKSGELIRSIKLADGMAASPISYAVDGKQFVAIMAGSTLTALALPD
jgi:alcohol dehydrogenase (cytochrome c)